MVGRIYHVGLTVSNLDKSIAFYRDVLGLTFQGEIMMVGEETDKMFQKKNCKARVAYLNGSENIETPPVELIQFVDNEVKKVQSNLFTSLRADCVLVIEEFTPRNALSRPVVSPPISTVIPLILFPMSAPPPKKT